MVKDTASRLGARRKDSGPAHPEPIEPPLCAARPENRIMRKNRL